MLQQSSQATSAKLIVHFNLSLEKMTPQSKMFLIASIKSLKYIHSCTVRATSYFSRQTVLSHICKLIRRNHELVNLSMSTVVDEDGFMLETLSKALMRLNMLKSFMLLHTNIKNSFDSSLLKGVLINLNARNLISLTLALPCLSVNSSREEIDVVKVFSAKLSTAASLQYLDLQITDQEKVSTKRLKPILSVIKSLPLRTFRVNVKGGNTIISHHDNSLSLIASRLESMPKLKSLDLDYSKYACRIMNHDFQKLSFRLKYLKDLEEIKLNLNESSHEITDTTLIVLIRNLRKLQQLQSFSLSVLYGNYQITNVFLLTLSLWISDTAALRCFELQVTSEDGYPFEHVYIQKLFTALSECKKLETLSLIIHKCRLTDETFEPFKSRMQNLEKLKVLQLSFYEVIKGFVPLTSATLINLSRSINKYKQLESLCLQFAGEEAYFAEPGLCTLMNSILQCNNLEKMDLSIQDTNGNVSDNVLCCAIKLLEKSKYLKYFCLYLIGQRVIFHKDKVIALIKLIKRIQRLRQVSLCLSSKGISYSEEEKVMEAAEDILPRKTVDRLLLEFYPYFL